MMNSISIFVHLQAISASNQSEHHVNHNLKKKRQEYNLKKRKLSSCAQISRTHFVTLHMILIKKY